MTMDFRFLCLLIILKWAHARQAVSPAFYFHSLQAYPAYQIVSAQQAGKTERDSTELPVEVSTTSGTLQTTSSSYPDTRSKIKSSAVEDTKTTYSSALPPLEASTANTIYTPAEFPRDLLEIARSKLGLKSLDEVPSISELAEYLGTVNAEETIKYIRQMTSTQQGITLIKAYLESADFTDRTEESRRQQATNVEPSTVSDSTKTPKNNLLERLAAYFKIYNLWPQSAATDATETRKKMQQQLSKYIKPQLQYRRRMEAAAAAHHAASHTMVTPHHKPLLVRNPLPYHYPIPLRPVGGKHLSPEQANVAGDPLSQPVALTPVHLNTPRFYVPPHIELARVANIPPQQLQSLLQSKPKLAELAAKVSHLPLTNVRSALINAQLLAAVTRAVEQDDDLRKLLQTTAETLK